ncbi:MAG: FKBP-type peptidyl-prolyl cis-trans isomerase [Flavisolibacter sp.]
MKFAHLISCLLVITMMQSSCGNIDFKKSKGGVPYKVFSEGKGKDTVAVSDIVKYQMIVKVKDSIVASTYWEFPRYEQVTPATNSYGDPHMELLTKAKKGDSIYYVQAMDSFIAHNPQILQQTNFKKGDRIVTTMRIIDVFKKPEQAQADYMKERAKYSQKSESDELKSFNSNPQAQQQMKTDSKIIEDYLAANHIQAEKTPWGIYIQTIAPGQGPKPSFGKYVSVKYTGTNLQGEVFDSGVIPFQLGGGQGTIKGFEEGVKQLSKGGRAKIYIPSILGYGPRGSEPKIKPNENLVFDMEILDISDTQPAPTQMPRDTSARR